MPILDYLVPNSIPVPDSLPEVDESKIFGVRLKPHQILSIDKAKHLESNTQIRVSDDGKFIKTKMGVFCDKVGAGKTLTILGLIADSPIPPTQNNSYSFTNTIRTFGYNRISSNCNEANQFLAQMSYTESDNSVVHPVNVIVVPHTIFSQWSNSIKTYTNIDFYEVKNTKTLNAFKTDYEKALPEDRVQKPIILVSNKFFRKFSEDDIWKGNKCVARVIYDEADTIDLPSNGQLPAKFYWLVTATYHSILYPNGYYVGGYGHNDNAPTRKKIPNAGFLRDAISSFSNLWSGRIGYDYGVSNILRKEIVSQVFIRNSDEFIESSFNLPVLRYILHKCNSPTVISVLNGVIPDHAMELLNAGDIDAAIDNISCLKVSDAKNLISVVTAEFEKNMKNAVIKFDAAQAITYSSENAKKESLKKHQEEIDGIKEQISNLQERISDASMCPICCDDINNRTLVRCCNNSFCFECISNSLAVSKNCPCCRANITADSLIITTGKEVSDAGGGAKEDTKYTKSRALQDIINANKETKNDTGEQCKYLVYSSSWNTFVEVSSILSENEIRNTTVKGSISHINNVITDFKNPESGLDAIMINAHFAASGMNLENTTDLIIYNKTDQGLMRQIIGRAQRPGRKAPLRVHLLAHENEVGGYSSYTN